jgi:hypothetical protein
VIAERLAESLGFRGREGIGHDDRVAKQLIDLQQDEFEQGYIVAVTDGF